MLTISHIKAPRFKGTDIDLDLDALNLIIGDYASGKTAIAQATKIGLYGCLPQFGERNATTFEATSDERELFVRLGFSDGQKNTVVVNRTTDGFTKKVELVVQPPLMLLDAQQYLDLTEAERLSYALGAVDLKRSGYDEQVLAARMFAENHDVTHKAIVAARSWFKIKCETRVSCHIKVSVWLDELLATFKKSEKVRKDTIKSATAAVGALTAVEPPNVSDKLEAARTALNAAITAEAKLNDLSDRTLLVARVNASKSELQRLRGQLDELDNEVEAMSRQPRCPTCHAAGTDWRKTWLAERAETEREMKAKVQTAVDALAVLEKQLTDYDKRRAGDKRIQQAHESKVACETRHTALADQHSQWQTWKRNTDQAAKSQGELATAQVELALTRQMISAVLDTQRDMAAKAFGSLLKVANLFTDGFMPALEYRGGVLGCDKRGVFATHRMLSGTERMVAFAGLQVALCQDSPLKLVILDDEANMPDTVRLRIMERLVELLADEVISQALIVNWTAKPYAKLKGKFKLIEV
jgi:FtsZ-binding cell division protein ZapB